MSITFNEIQKANSTISTTNIKGKEYAEVNQRIKAFRMVYPQGSIITELVSNENGVCVFRATAADECGNVLGTGTAYEKESSSYINKTSYIENCETSAVGRALGMCGFGIDTSVASAEEVTNAINNQHKTDTKYANDKDVAIIKQLAEQVNIPIVRVQEGYQVKNISQLTEEQAKECISGLQKRIKKANGQV